MSCRRCEIPASRARSSRRLRFFLGIEVTQFRTMTPVMKREKDESVASPPTV